MFLKTRKQRVQVGGAFSSPTPVDSWVPQGMVLGALLFLMHINDLPQVVSSRVRLFADDCLLYDTGKIRQPCKGTRPHSASGVTPGVRSLMQPNVILCVSPARRPFIPSFVVLTFRSLLRSTKLNISGSQYPTRLAGLPILAALSVRPTPPWASSDAIYAAVPRSSKRQPTSILVRSVLEFAATIWEPHQSKDINA